jgi:hypothetical protein
MILSQSTIRRKAKLFSFFAPDCRGKPFEAKTAIFLNKKERPTEAPFLFIEKCVFVKKLETESRIRP